MESSCSWWWLHDESVWQSIHVGFCQQHKQIKEMISRGKEGIKEKKKRTHKHQTSWGWDMRWEMMRKTSFWVHIFFPFTWLSFCFAFVRKCILSQKQYEWGWMRGCQVKEQLSLGHKDHITKKVLLGSHNVARLQSVLPVFWFRKKMILKPQSDTSCVIEKELKIVYHSHDSLNVSLTQSEKTHKTWSEAIADRKNFFPLSSYSSSSSLFDLRWDVVPGLTSSSPSLLPRVTEETAWDLVFQKSFLIPFPPPPSLSLNFKWRRRLSTR